MKRTHPFALLLILIVMLLAACGGAATTPEAAVEPAADTAAEPTATQPPVEEPTTALTEEPTVAPTAEPMDEPTATAEPTAEPTDAPLPVISPETLVGMFNQFDTEAGGNNWLLFNADGTFVGRHGPTFDTGVLVTEGTYTLEGDVLTLVDAEQCPTGESYRLAYRTQTQVHFEVAGDVTCDYLAEDTQRLPNWKRVEE
jgi:hypothetical protein